MFDATAFTSLEVGFPPRRTGRLYPFLPPQIIVHSLFTLADTRRVFNAQLCDKLKYKEDKAAAAAAVGAAEGNEPSLGENDDGCDDSKSESTPASYIEPHYTMWKCVDQDEDYAAPETLKDELEQLREYVKLPRY